MRIDWQKGTFVAASAVALVLLNLIALRFFGRFDLTPDKAYTLSKGTKATLDALQDPVTVTAYFSKDLPAPYAGTRQYVLDMLNELRSASKGKVAFELVDPSAQTGGEKRETKQDIFGRVYRDPSPLEKQLMDSGIQPVEIRVVDTDQSQTRRAWMGIVMKYGGKQEVLPIVRGNEGLEFELTSMMRRLVRTRTPVIGILQGHGEIEMNRLRALQSALAQGYTLKPVTLGSPPRIGDDVDALLVIGPQTPMPPEHQEAIEAFALTGKGVGIFSNAYNVSMETFIASPTAAAIAQLLSPWGIRLGRDLVGDVSAATIGINEQRGAFTIQTPIAYPFLPVVRALEAGSPISQGLGNVVFPFAVEVSLSPVEGVKDTVLARSSPRSWLENPPPQVSPHRDWASSPPTFSGPYNLLVQVEGTPKGKTGSGRLVVAGSSGLALDDFIGESGGNQALLQNIVDWMVLDPAVLALRVRGLRVATIDPSHSDAFRAAIRWFNIAGLPLAVIVLGLVSWRLRESRRRSASL